MLSFKTLSCAVSGSLDARKMEMFVHSGLAELLFDLGLEDIQFVLHVPVKIREALLRGVVVCKLPLLVCECGNHAFVELFDLGSRFLSVLVGGGTFRTDFAHSHVLQLL